MKRGFIVISFLGIILIIAFISFVSSEYIACLDNPSGFTPNPSLYPQILERNYPGHQAVVLHRKHVYCSNGEPYELAMKGLEEQYIVLHTEKRDYCNYICRDRYKEQCIDDGSFDTYYKEWCEDANGNVINVGNVTPWSVNRTYSCYSDMDCPVNNICYDGKCMLQGETSPFEVSSCTLSAPFSCSDASVNSNGVKLVVQNGGGQTINLQSVTIVGCGLNNNNGVGWTIHNQNIVEIMIKCDLSSRIYQEFSGDITLNYNTVGSSIQQVATGTMSNTVKPSDEETLNSCSVSAPWGCDQNELLVTTDSIKIALDNGAGQQLDVKSIEISGCGIRRIESDSLYDQEKWSVPNQEQFEITIKCNSPLTVGDTFTGDITIIYKMSGGSLDLTSSGSLTNVVKSSNVETPKCTDSDKGLNFNLKGVAKGIASWGNLESVEVFEDYCHNQKELNEIYCGDDGLVYQEPRVYCQNGCGDGTCLIGDEGNEWGLGETITPVKDCYDSDSGMDYYNKGIITVEGEEYASDSCVDKSPLTGAVVSDSSRKGMVLEYFCYVNLDKDFEEEGDYVVVTQHYSCPKGCKDGACIGKSEEDYNIKDKKEDVCRGGCSLDNKCYPFGYRKEGKYCSDNFKFLSQLNRDLKCDNNFECTSNVCVSGKCVSQGLLEKVLNWFKNLFGG